MKRTVTVLFLSISLFALSAARVHAAIITVDPQGKVIWSVLSLQDELMVQEDVEDFFVRKVAEINTVGNDIINVEQDNGRVKLSVGTGENVRQLDLDKTEEALIEIEERPAVRKLVIGHADDGFTIKQRGTTVNTSLPIQVNPESARLAFRTSGGNNFLYILPEEAVISVFRTRVATRLRAGEDIELKEEQEKLVYKIPGQKVIHILDLYDYVFSVDTYVSAQTGEVVEVEAPVWYKIFGFLITQQS